MGFEEYLRGNSNNPIQIDEPLLLGHKMASWEIYPWHDMTSLKFPQNAGGIAPLGK
jgi:hypothetical protein